MNGKDVKKTWKVLCIVFAVLILSGCATSKIETKRLTAWNEATVENKKDVVSSSKTFSVENFKAGGGQFEGDVQTVTSTRYESYTQRTIPVYEETWSTPYTPRHFDDPITPLFLLASGILEGVLTLNPDAPTESMNYLDKNNTRMVNRRCIDHETSTGSSSYSSEVSREAAPNCTLSISCDVPLLSGGCSRSSLVADSQGHFTVGLNSPPYFTERKSAELYSQGWFAAIQLSDRYLASLKANPVFISSQNAQLTVSVQPAGSIAGDSKTLTAAVWFADVNRFQSEIRQIAQDAVKCSVPDRSEYENTASLKRYPESRKKLLDVFNAMVSELVQISAAVKESPGDIRTAASAYSSATHRDADSFVSLSAGVLAFTGSYLDTAVAIDQKLKTAQQYDRDLRWNRAQLESSSTAADRIVNRKKVLDTESLLAALKTEITDLQKKLQSSGMDAASLTAMHEQAKNDYDALKGMHDAYLSSVRTLFDAAIADPRDRPAKLSTLRNALDSAVRFAKAQTDYLSIQQDQAIFNLNRY